MLDVVCVEEVLDGYFLDIGLLYYVWWQEVIDVMDVDKEGCEW